MSLIIHRFLDNILFSTITWIILFMFSNDVQVMIHKKITFLSNAIQWWRIEQFRRLRKFKEILYY